MLGIQTITNPTKFIDDQEANEDQDAISRASTEDMESFSDNPKTPIRKYDGPQRDYERGDHYGGERTRSKPETP